MNGISNNAEVYLVGGAVRDKLLGRDTNDRDWVVIGSTPQAMIQDGFTPCGKDFPVFLHPTTKDEYALARTERKTAPGHTGFAINADPVVTLEEDLLRRDLTINAIAWHPAGFYIDPFDGRRDLKNRELRHVSDAFREDPVRILRTARLAAQLSEFEFTVAPHTKTLMREMVENGEVDSLIAERVWKETGKALMSPKPSVYFEILREVGALAKLMPEVDALFGIPQPEKHHPEIDTGVHAMMVVDAAARKGASLAARWAALTHDLGKAITPQDQWPNHHGHEAAGVPLVKSLSARLKVPKRPALLAEKVAKEHLRGHLAFELKPKTALDLLEILGAFSQSTEAFADALVAFECDAQGRAGFENAPYPQKDFLQRAALAASRITAADALDRGLRGPAVGEDVRRRRVAAIANFKREALDEPASPPRTRGRPRP